MSDTCTCLSADSFPQWGVVTRGDFTGEAADIESTAMIGGDISMQSYNVGSRLDDSYAGQVTLASPGADCEFVNFELSTGIYEYANAYTATDSTFVDGTLASTDGSLEAEVAGTWDTIEATSAALSAEASANGLSATVEEWGAIEFDTTGANAASNGLFHFNVDGADLVGNTGVTITMGEGEFVAIEVAGSGSIELSNFGFFPTDDSVNSNVVWNFAGYDEIVIDGLGWVGTLLAPNADLVFSNGQWLGSVYVNSVVTTGVTDGEFHDWTPSDWATCECEEEEEEDDDGCCMICTTGKACGDSCISQDYTCSQPDGCACDAETDDDTIVVVDDGSHDDDEACVIIEFEYFEYTYECNAVDVASFEYPTVFAYDSHNAEIDVCERVYYEGAFDEVSGQEMCCTPDERWSMSMGCDQVVDSGLFSESASPDACSEVEDELCGAMDSSAVAQWNVFYDSCDLSYNCAEQVGFDINYEDTTPPVIGGSCDDVWEEHVEKCTYFDGIETSAFDSCDLQVDVEESITFGCTVTTGESDTLGYMVGTASGHYGTGGVVVDSVDEDTTGTYCLEYTAVDNSGNWAWRETYVVYVEDTHDCEISFETEYNMHECGEDTDIIDYGEIATNLPCSDEFEPSLEYTFDGNHKIFYSSAYDGDCSDATAVNYFSDDGEGNDCTACTFYEIEDTTPPTITCPGDIEVETEQNGGVWECDYDGVFAVCEAEAADSCDDGFSQSDNREVVDMRTVGTYMTTFCAEDDAGNTACCEHETVVIDSHSCLCDANACDPYVEACEDQYFEEGAYCYDLYDGDIERSSDPIEIGEIAYVINAGPNDEGAATCEDASCVDVSSPGVYTVYYWASDSSGNTCGASVDVTVEDSTPPVVTFSSDDETVWFEASLTDDAGVYYGEDYVVGCSDTCDVDSLSFDATTLDYEYALATAISMDSYVATEGTCGDLECNTDNGFTYQGTLSLGGSDAEGYKEGFKGYASEDHYYCGGDYDISEATRLEAVAQQDFDYLANECAIYEVVFTCNDVNGNSATLTEYVVTVDTSSPVITPMMFAVVANVAGASAGPMGFVALVALVAAVAYKSGRRQSGYIPI